MVYTTGIKTRREGGGEEGGRRRKGGRKNHEAASIRRPLLAGGWYGEHLRLTDSPQPPLKLHSRERQLVSSVYVRRATSERTVKEEKKQAVGQTFMTVWRAHRLHARALTHPVERRGAGEKINIAAKNSHSSSRSQVHPLGGAAESRTNVLP